MIEVELYLNSKLEYISKNIFNSEWFRKSGDEICKPQK